MILTRKFLSLSLLTLLIPVFAGCGNGLNMGTVSGTVTLDGQPLENAQLQFYPVATGRASFGRTDADGKYQLIYSTTAAGALQGKHSVEITTNIEDDSGKMRPERVPEKYRGPDSELSVVVERGSNVLNFDLLTDEKEKKRLEKFNAAQEKNSGL